MPDQSTIFFPLRTNAAALYAGPGVAAVRRRILAAGLLHDRVVLEDGAYIAWAGPHGGSALMMHGEKSVLWQTPQQRGKATGAQHYVGGRPEAAGPGPMHAFIVTDATFSWRATLEPFRAELPASAAGWLHYGHVEDEGLIGETVRGWEAADRLARIRRPPSPARDGFFVESRIVKDGYFDLATSARTRSAISMDRRHTLAVTRRLESGDAERVGGHYALSVLLPLEFTWADVPALVKHRAIRDYRSIIRDIEAASLDVGTSISDVDERIRREYRDRLVAASAKGVPFGGRVAMAAIGVVAGAVADQVAPFVGGAAVGAAGFAAGEVLDRSLKPRWLTIDRRLNGRPRNGV